MKIYRTIEDNNDTFNAIVMGPWEHGGWARRGMGPNDIYAVGKLGVASGLQSFYQNQLEAPFFRHFLKGQGDAPDYEAMMYDLGIRKWRKYSSWPPKSSKVVKSYLTAGGKLISTAPDSKPDAEGSFSEFISNPMDPVPYRDRSDIVLRFTPRPFMSDDQRFATAREDVLTFQTEVLENDVTLTGDLLAHLKVSTSQSAADWIVKLIDVYPDDHPFVAGSNPDLNFGGFQQMVRSEVFRGRFRNSYEKPEPFVSGEITTVEVPLQDVCHTFKKGHRMMVHVQSSMFPYIDRNPQKYVDNIFEAEDADFVTATHRVYHNSADSSWVEMKVLQ
jgi:putative CocE/NonD family hydrolase